MANIPRHPETTDDPSAVATGQSGKPKAHPTATRGLGRRRRAGDAALRIPPGSRAVRLDDRRPVSTANGSWPAPNRDAWWRPARWVVGERVLRRGRGRAEHRIWSSRRDGQPIPDRRFRVRVSASSPMLCARSSRAFWRAGSGRRCELDAVAARDPSADSGDGLGTVFACRPYVGHQRLERPEPQVIGAPPAHLVEQPGIDPSPDHRRRVGGRDR